MKLSPRGREFLRVAKEVYVGVCILLTSLFLFIIFIEIRFPLPAPKPTPNLQGLYNQLGITPSYLKDEAVYRGHLMYHPYDGSRMRPFHSATINVGQDGFREVPQPCTPEQQAIWVMGGSTVYGTGVPDDQTIPAYLQRFMREHTGGCVNVYNRGVVGWVNSQEMIYLVEELKAGHVPQIVIFYDGFNEILRALESGEVGTTASDQQFSDYVDGGNRLLELVAARQRWKGSRFFSTLFPWMRKYLHCRIPFIPYLEKSRYPPYGYQRVTLNKKTLTMSPEELARFAQGVVKVYTDNMTFILRLARQYHFKVAFYWQPSLLDDNTKKLTPYESQYAQNRLSSEIRLMRAVEEILERHPGPIHLMKHALDDISQTTYLDLCHLLPKGNKRIAWLMDKDLTNSSSSPKYTPSSVGD